MMCSSGFILLYRQITEWEWYQNPNTFRVFLHLLLKANFTDGSFEGRVIKRGQMITSLPQLSQQTKLSIQNVRTALSHLKSTGEITDEATRQYRLITIVKYNDYQKDNRRDNSQSTDDQQTINRQGAENQQQYNNKDIKKEKRKNHSIFIVPSVDDVKSYLEQIGNYTINPQAFIDYYQARGWTLKGGTKIKDWKACIRTWISNERKREEEDRRRQLYDDLPM